MLTRVTALSKKLLIPAADMTWQDHYSQKISCALQHHNIHVCHIHHTITNGSHDALAEQLMKHLTLKLS